MATFKNDAKSHLSPNWGLYRISHHRELDKPVWPSPEEKGCTWEYHCLQGRGKGVTIYVVDSGFDDNLKNHKEFSSCPEKSKMRKLKIPFPKFQAEEECRQALKKGHGNKVAMTACGALLGAAPEADLVMVEVYTDLETVHDALKEILHDVQTNENKGKPAIINVSLSASRMSEVFTDRAKAIEHGTSEDQQAFYKQLQIKIKGTVNTLFACNVLTVVSAGNDGVS